MQHPCVSEKQKRKSCLLRIPTVGSVRSEYRHLVSDRNSPFGGLACVFIGLGGFPVRPSHTRNWSMHIDAKIPPTIQQTIRTRLQNLA